MILLVPGRPQNCEEHFTIAPPPNSEMVLELIRDYSYCTVVILHSRSKTKLLLMQFQECIRDSQSATATTFSWPGMCRIWKSQFCKKTRELTTIISFLTSTTASIDTICSSSSPSCSDCIRSIYKLNR